MRGETTLAFALTTLLLALAVACGSGVNSDDEPIEGLDIVGTLSGVIDYEGDLAGDHIVVGLMDEWPMTGPPKEFIEVEIPADGFPIAYSVEIHYPGDYFLAAYLDVDPMDGVMMNAELDPMDVPDEGEEKTEIVEGQNQRDFLLVDADEVDWWWEE